MTTAPHPLRFVGFVGNHNSSEIIPRQGPVVDRDYIEATAKAHEYGGFDAVLQAFHSDAPDSLQVSQHITSVTERLNVLIAHRPGFQAPTILARQFATLDQLSRGRTAINVITGAERAELARDGNTLEDKDERYARTSEFLDIVRAEWTSQTPFDYQGRFYQVEQGFSLVKPYRESGIPVWIAGASQAAIDVAGRHADTFALWGETHDQVRELLSRVRAAAVKNNRPVPAFSLSLRPVLADTEEAAWAKADAIYEKAKALLDKTGFRRGDLPNNEGARRLLSIADQGHRHDTRLWTAIAGLTGAKGNSTSLVGTPDQVADALLDYYDLGVTTFLIRGFDPLPDSIAYGRELLPRVRQLVAERERARAVAAE